MKPDKKFWIAAAKWGAAAVALLLVIQKVPFQGIGSVLEKCRWPLLLGAVLIQFPLAVINAMRWKLLLQEKDLPLVKYLYFVFLGSAFSLFMPTAVLSEAAKVIAFGRKYGGLQVNIGIALFSKGMGFLVQFLLGAAGLLLYARELQGKGVSLGMDWNRPVVWCLGLAVLGVGIFFLGKSTLRGKVREWMRIILSLASDPVLLVKTFFLTCLIQLLSVASGYLVFLSLFPETNFWQVLLFSAIIMAVLVLPLSLGGFGVREYLNLALYTDIGGIPAQTVFAINLLSYVPLLAVATTGFGWMAFRKFERRNPE